MSEPKCILVVDDEPPLLQMVSMMLADTGYKILLAENGKIAYELLTSKTENIALVLCDVRMPQMSGPELAKKIKDLNTPIVFMSGYSDVNIQQLSVEGARGFIKKPFLCEELLAIIESVLK